MSPQRLRKPNAKAEGRGDPQAQGEAPAVTAPMDRFRSLARKLVRVPREELLEKQREHDMTARPRRRSTDP
jgi:hypothetical protein